MEEQTRYAHSGDLHIAYQAAGDGPLDLLYVPTWIAQLAVMGATRTERASLMASLEGGPLAMLFAATHPSRVDSLILYTTYARTRWAPDYDWPPQDDERDARIADLVAQWGQGAVPAALAPSLGNDR